MKLASEKKVEEEEVFDEEIIERKMMDKEEKAEVTASVPLGEKGKKK